VSLTAALDALSAEHLRARGGAKWTGVGGGGLGAGLAEMDFPVARAIVETLVAEVATARFGYLGPVLAEEMAAACAAWQRERYGWRVAPSDVHPVADVQAAFEYAVRCFSRPDSPVVVPTPGYMPFLATPAAHGRVVVPVPMARAGNRWALDLDGLAAAFRAGGHLLVLCNPANPTGRVYTRAELTAISDVVEAHGGRVFADEIHAPLVYACHRHVPYASLSPATAAHTITATSATKGWNLPGLKCAQVIVSNPADAETWRRIEPSTAFGASPLGAVATTAAYTAGGEWLAGVVGYLDRNRRALGELLAVHLPGVLWEPPEGTYLTLLDCRGLDLPCSPGEFFRRRAGVLLVDGSECGEAARGHARLNFATPLPVLTELVARMGAAVRAA